MKKREFLKVASTITAGTIISPIAACNTATKEEDEITKFILPDLPYAYDALEPFIDKTTMQIHHSKHHAGYVKKLNAAKKGTKYDSMKLDELIANVSNKDTGVRNNGGGHFNHSLFWEILTPSSEVSLMGKLLDAINGQFDSFDRFKDLFFDAAKGRFGSGWAWLCIGETGLFISSTPNQDNPLMKKIVKENGTPILGIDVWEHAYYLNYQNRRGDYINNFFNIINWEEVAKRFEKYS